MATGARGLHLRITQRTQFSGKRLFEACRAGREDMKDFSIKHKR
jgi:hypothetical protein